MKYQSAWQSICANEYEKAAQEALRVYAMALAEIKVPYEHTAENLKRFKNASKEALSVLRRMTVGLEQSDNESLLINRLKEVYEQKKIQN